LPYGGVLQPVEWLDAKAMSFGRRAIRGDGRYAYVDGDGALVQIDATRFRVIDRGLGFADTVGWDSTKKCWTVDAFRKKHLVCDR